MEELIMSAANFRIMRDVPLGDYSRVSSPEHTR